MAIPIEAYTGEGVLTGVVDAPGRLRDVLETFGEVRVAPYHGLGLDGRREEAAAAILRSDALLLVVPDETEVPVHATWHDVSLDIGPYHITGQLPTLPGFDPGRALARPTGTFVLLREATVRLREDHDIVIALHGRILVNRYDVEAVSAALMLGFFFPGAHLEVLGDSDDGTETIGMFADEELSPV